MNDLKLLIEILIREIEMNRSCTCLLIERFEPVLDNWCGEWDGREEVVGSS
jgi:hypothetical protein